MGSINEKENDVAFKKVDNKKKEEDMTHGVDIFKLTNPENNKILTIWDFAGFKFFF